MKLKSTLFSLLFILGITSASFSQGKDLFTTFTFKANDGIVVTADYYKIGEEQPYMLLFHQAGYSRGEYREAAPQFMKLGYNCIAIDQRSGSETKGVVNETSQFARKNDQKTDYLSAYKDMEAALAYAYKTARKRVVIVGSSYSASLVFRLALEHKEMVRAIVSYSPGEYFNEISVSKWMSAVTVPMLLTSSRKEAPKVTLLIGENKKVIQFIPKGAGIHGSRALWKSTPNNQEYWIALREFLARI